MFVPMHCQLHTHGLNQMMIENILEENTCICSERVKMLFLSFFPKSEVYNMSTEN